MLEVTLIIAAMKEELNGLLTNLEHYEIRNVDDMTIYSFEINNTHYLAYLGKIGKVHTAFVLGQLSRSVKIKRIINIGTAGGYSKDLKPLDVVVASKVCYHDVDVKGFGYSLGQMPACPLYFECDVDYLKKNLKKLPQGFKTHYGVIASGDSFITKDNIKNFPIKSFDNVLALDMEAGAVGQVAHILNIPYIVIRSISDLVLKNNNAKTFDDTLERASENSAKVLLSLIK